LDVASGFHLRRTLRWTTVASAEVVSRTIAVRLSLDRLRTTASGVEGLKADATDI